jgi:hypothetical protein
VYVHTGVLFYFGTYGLGGIAEWLWSVRALKKGVVARE